MLRTLPLIVLLVITIALLVVARRDAGVVPFIAAGIGLALLVPLAAIRRPPAETAGDVLTADQPWVAMPQARTLLIVTITVLATAFLSLLAYMLFVAFPALTETGDAQLQVWLGPQGSRFGYMLIGALITAPYVWVTAQGTRERGAATAYPWLVGALVGGIAGLVYVSLGAITGLMGQHDPVIVLGLTMLAAPIVAGITVGKLTDQAGSAILGGFWCGLALTQVVATGWAARDLVLADRLAHTIWVGDTFHDVRCSVGGTILAACEIGDDLGGLAIQLLILPLISAGLGGLAGLAGRALAATQVQVDSGWSRAVVAPVVFAVIMAVMLTAELTFNLW